MGHNIEPINFADTTLASSRTTGTDSSTRIASDSLRGQLIDPNAAATLVNDAAGKAFWNLAQKPGGLQALADLLYVVRSAGGTPTPTTSSEPTVSSADLLNQVARSTTTGGPGQNAFNLLDAALGSTKSLTASEAQTIKDVVGELNEGKITEGQFSTIVRRVASGAADAGRPAGNENGYLSGLRDQLKDLPNMSIAQIGQLTQAVAMLLGTRLPPGFGYESGNSGSSSTNPNVEVNVSINGVGNSSTFPNAQKSSPDNSRLGIVQQGDFLVLDRSVYNPADVNYQLSNFMAENYLNGYGQNKDGNTVVELKPGSKEGLTAVLDMARLITTGSRMQQLAAVGNIKELNNVAADYQQKSYS